MKPQTFIKFCHPSKIGFNINKNLGFKVKQLNLRVPLMLYLVLILTKRPQKGKYDVYFIGPLTLARSQAVCEWLFPVISSISNGIGIIYKVTLHPAVEDEPHKTSLQASKLQSYASSKLRPTNPEWLTGVKCRATSAARNELIVPSGLTWCVNLWGKCAIFIKSKWDIREYSSHWSDDRDYARLMTTEIRLRVAAGKINERKQYGSLSPPLLSKNL